VSALTATARARLEWARLRALGDKSLEQVDARVQSGDVLADIGAAWGMFTARFAELAGPSGRVHAFEPNPSYDRFLDPIAQQATVTLHRVALSDRPGSTELHVPVVDGKPLPALGSVAAPPEREHRSLAIEMTTLDDALGADAERVAFVKCDVEGHELAVLRGAANTFENARPALLVELEYRHAGDQMRETLDLLAAWGYDGQAIGRNGPFPLTDFDLERDQLAYLEDGVQAEMPDGYVNDFLFTPREPRPRARG
jgi:FkbM family methyltransferase